MGKNIAIFADGTGNTVGKHDSNVLRLCRLADIRNPLEQLVIYDSGVGTRRTPAELKDAFRRLGTCDCIGPLPIDDSPRGLASLQGTTTRATTYISSVSAVARSPRAPSPD